MKHFYNPQYDCLDIEHVMFLREVLIELKHEVVSIPEEYLMEEDVRIYLEDRFDWFAKLQLELDLLLLDVIH